MTAVTEIRLPQFGMGMQEGTIITWLKREGDPVTAGEVVAEIEAEKVTEDLVATGGGVLQRILVPEGETVAVNELLAIIAPIGAAPPDTAEDKREAAEEDPEAVAAAPPAADRPAPATAGGGSRRQVTPRARRLAADLGVDLDSVPGTGPGGRVTEDDVTAASGA
ncbi:MAG: E3 binding domain-containing protein [bacterium]|nr:E3 binding domain-containing protein [bacterium]